MGVTGNELINVNTLQNNNLQKVISEGGAKSGAVIQPSQTLQLIIDLIRRLSPDEQNLLFTLMNPRKEEE